MSFKKKSISFSKLSAVELFLKLTGVDYTKCPQCKKGKMVTKQKFIPKICSPPGDKIKTV
jgi:hypothetical protein